MNHFIKYNCIGAINTLIGFWLIFVCMHEFRISPQWSNLIGYTVGIMLSYQLNKHLNFKTAKKSRLEFLKFVLTTASAYLCNLTALYFFINSVHANPYIAQIIAGIFYVLISFLLCKFTVFTSPAD